MKLYPDQLITYQREKEQVSLKVKRGLDDKVYTYQNFAGKYISTVPLFKFWVLNDGKMLLPEAQHNRKTQIGAIYSLIEAGFIVKSYSYFGSTSWRSKKEFGFIEMFAKGQVHFDKHGEPVEAMRPRQLFYQNAILFTLNGQESSTFDKLNFDNNSLYDGARKYFRTIRVGNRSYKFINSATYVSPVIELMQEEDEIVTVIAWLKRGAKHKGRFKTPPCSWLQCVKGGKALRYDGKDYFNEDSLIARLSKSLRWS